MAQSQDRGEYLTMPTSPPGARTESPTRRVSGDPFVDRVALLPPCCSDVDRDPAGLEGMEDVVLESDLRPSVEDLLEVDVVEYVGEARLEVPREGRDGAAGAVPRANLLPAPARADGRPIGVGVEYITLPEHAKRLCWRPLDDDACVRFMAIVACYMDRGRGWLPVDPSLIVFTDFSTRRSAAGDRYK